MINICFSSDNNYAQHLGVTLASLLENNKTEVIRVFVLDGGITEENKNNILKLKEKYAFEIVFLNIDKSLFDKCPAGKKNHVTLATYYRLLLSEICPEVDKILYLDVDLIIRSNIKELFETDIEDYYFAGVSDCEEHINAPRLGLKTYCNAGVILLNLKKWRTENITEKFFDWIEKNSSRIVLHDQDILNATLQEHILKLDKKWNVQVSKYETSKQFVALLGEAKIIHYIGKHKPWHPDNKQVAKDEYFKYLKLTAWSSYKSEHDIKYLFNMPLEFLGNVAHFIFALEKQNGQKVLQILGLKFNIR
ncbi:glycosyltransferase family 8 protein [bacterium]|nr:glycosyltransferase family 8 protein [bacterium]